MRGGAAACLPFFITPARSKSHLSGGHVSEVSRRCLRSVSASGVSLEVANRTRQSRRGAISRLHLGYLSAISRLHLGYLSATSRLSLGCLSAVSPLYLGYLSAVPRLYLGYFSVTSRLYLGVEGLEELAIVSEEEGGERIPGRCLGGVLEESRRCLGGVSEGS